MVIKALNETNTTVVCRCFVYWMNLNFAIIVGVFLVSMLLISALTFLKQWLPLLTCYSRTHLLSASSWYTIGRLPLTQLLTSVIGIPNSLYHFGISSFQPQRFRGLPLGRLSTGWITSALLWGAVGAVLLTCDSHVILFLFAISSAGCMFNRRLISSFLISSILVFLAAYPLLT